MERLEKFKATLQLTSSVNLGPSFNFLSTHMFNVDNINLTSCHKGSKDVERNSTKSYYIVNAQSVVTVVLKYKLEVYFRLTEPNRESR